MPSLTLPASTLVTRQSIAARLGLSTRTIDDLTAKGRIPFFKIGKAVRFDPIEVEAHLRRTAHVNAQTR
jgi:excisionase family DNA binding protein